VAVSGNCEPLPSSKVTATRGVKVATTEALKRMTRVGGEIPVGGTCPRLQVTMLVVSPVTEHPSGKVNAVKALAGSGNGFPPSVIVATAWLTVLGPALMNLILMNP